MKEDTPRKQVIVAIEGPTYCEEDEGRDLVPLPESMVAEFSKPTELNMETIRAHTLKEVLDNITENTRAVILRIIINDPDEVIGDEHIIPERQVEREVNSLEAVKLIRQVIKTKCRNKAIIMLYYDPAVPEELAIRNTTSIRRLSTEENGTVQELRPLPGDWTLLKSKLARAQKT
ncbi:hypothetical protein HOF67_00430 [Candidatus Peregrinibacteria bacterium]|nr:hypothetical protein [Candidatus Peregrinibacteria bacterium]